MIPKSAADRQLEDCIAEEFESFVGGDRFLVVFVAKRAVGQGLLEPLRITKAVLKDRFEFCWVGGGGCVGVLGARAFLFIGRMRLRGSRGRRMHGTSKGRVGGIEGEVGGL